MGKYQPLLIKSRLPNRLMKNTRKNANVCTKVHAHLHFLRFLLIGQGDFCRIESCSCLAHDLELLAPSWHAESPSRSFYFNVKVRKYSPLFWRCNFNFLYLNNGVAPMHRTSRGVMSHTVGMLAHGVLDRGGSPQVRSTPTPWS